VKRRATTVGIVAAAAGAAGLGVALWQARGRGERGAATADATDPHGLYALRFVQPGGAMLELAQFRGRALLLNFWATWCPPCVREMPMIERFYQAQRAQAQAAGRPAWRILGLAVDKRAAVAEYLARQPVSYDIAVAGFDAMQWGRDWGNDKNGLPFTVAFAADGRVLARKSGELVEGELERWPLA